MEENKNTENQAETSAEEQKLSQEEINLLIEKLKLEQNLPMAIISGLGSAIVMAVIWAAITVATEYQIGYMAIAVGFIVGFAVKFFGKGIDKIFGVIGAASALLGCFLGNFLSQVGFIAIDPEINMSYSEALKLLLSDMALSGEIMKQTFSPIDLLFYGIAIYVGFRYSIRAIAYLKG